jgi:hypothetical protein
VFIASFDNFYDTIYGDLFFGYDDLVDIRKLLARYISFGNSLDEYNFAVFAWCDQRDGDSFFASTTSTTYTVCV